jgi:hypothetical protein
MPMPTREARRRLGNHVYRHALEDGGQVSAIARVEPAIGCRIKEGTDRVTPRREGVEGKRPQMEGAGGPGANPCILLDETDGARWMDPSDAAVARKATAAVGAEGGPRSAADGLRPGRLRAEGWRQAGIQG